MRESKSENENGIVYDCSRLSLEMAQKKKKETHTEERKKAA
jgi:hypothetical protein